MLRAIVGNSEILAVSARAARSGPVPKDRPDDAGNVHMTLYFPLLRPCRLPLNLGKGQHLKTQE